MNESNKRTEELTKKLKNSKHPNIKRQSKNIFRTSFTVSEPTFSLMNKIKDYYGVSNKELIDIIIEFFENNSEVLDYILKSLEERKEANIIGEIKTFIISNDAKNFLKDNSWSISRDALLNDLIIGFNIRFEQLLEEQKMVVTIIEEFIPKSFSEIYKKLENNLAVGDPIWDRIDLIEYAWQKLVEAIKSKLNDNVQIDQRDIEQNC